MSPSIPRAALTVLLATALAGCAAKPSAEHERSAPQPVAVATSAAATPTTLVKRGTTVDGKLNVTLDSGKNQDGDKFTLALAPGLFGKRALKGVVLEGHLEGVKSAAKFGKKGELDVVFDDLKTADGQVLPVEAKLASAPKAQGTKLRTAAIVLGSAVIGRHVAKSTGKKHGALAGAAVGAAVALALPGGNVVLKSGTPLSVKFTGDVTQ